MVISINPDLCTGCGTCANACPTEAIRISADRAVIEEAACTLCEICVETCPSDAISVDRLPVRDPVPEIIQPVVVQEPLTEKDALVPATFSRSAFAPLASASLTFIGHEILPRLADALIATLERRLARSKTTAIARVSTPSRSLAVKGRGERRQARFRGGRASTRNHKERR